ncbi:MAG: flagellar biosynthesis protein FlhB [Candidatus Sericytochromatia bacterium]|nr:flagellar biosynthesis protein FlhB [Candidatus Sericytochromatia bacterium]
MAEPEKTEEATPKRRSDARNKGNVLRSNDVAVAGTLAVALLLFRLNWARSSEALASLMERRLGSLHAPDMTAERLGTMLLEDGGVLISVAAPFALGLMLAGLVIQRAMVGQLLTTEPLRPDLKRIDPIAGFKRLVSGRAVMELVKNLAKMAVLGGVSWQVLQNAGPGLVVALGSDPGIFAPRIGSALWTLGVRIVLVLLAFAAFDWWWQKRSYEKSLKMSKQEVKDENRNSEGDPLIKGEIRKRMRQAARRRMMQQVPLASVVVTNPTHFAVALRYHPEDVPVPIVIAKGTDEIALRIRELARQHGVPVVENPPLARQMMRQVELGETIPAELYQVVAEILVSVQRAGV